MKWDKLPEKIRRKATAALDSLSAGATVRDLRGKRLQHDRTIVSVPLGRRWRMLLRETDDALELMEVLSHEQYSKGARPGKR